jgi:hypothetical protein
MSTRETRGRAVVAVAELAALALALVLTGCGSSRPVANAAATPSHKPTPQWCQDAHGVASEISSAAGLDDAKVQSWFDDASTINH